MLKKLKVILVGGLALCCLYLFAVYLRTDGGESIKSTISLTDAGIPHRHAAGHIRSGGKRRSRNTYYNTYHHIRRPVDKEHLRL